MHHFSSTKPRRAATTSAVRACIIFNPVAKGEKARRFRRHLGAFGASCELRGTTAPGEARHLAAQAIADGFDTLVAAGGDGTLNEVLNGIGDAPAGFERVRLGVLPLGTVNVFAREMQIPPRLPAAWKTVLAGHETCIDLAWVEFVADGTPQRRCCVQLAGAGLDARAIELVDWPLKKKTGVLAYIVAGVKAISRRQSKIIVTPSSGGPATEGELVLIGNGQLYGGNFRVFPSADLRDGRLDVCVLPRVNWLTLLRCAPALLLGGRLPEAIVNRFQAAAFTLSAAAPVPFEVDGEWAGRLPVTFTVQRGRVRVLAPDR